MVWYQITYGDYGGVRRTMNKKFLKKSTAEVEVSKLKRKNKNPYAKKHFDPLIIKRH